jgi:thiol-disulfide isomerase/thioredoxin
LLIALGFVLLAVAIQFASGIVERMTNKPDLTDFTGIAFFVMEDCPHCKQLKAETLSKLENDPTYKEKIRVIDNKKDADLDQKYKSMISGYPTMIVFKNGAPQGKFEGGRDLASVKQKLDEL